MYSGQVAALSGTGPRHPSGNLAKSLPVDSPSQDRVGGSNPAGATNLFGLRSSAKFFFLPPTGTGTLLCVGAVLHSRPRPHERSVLPVRVLCDGASLREHFA